MQRMSSNIRTSQAWQTKPTDRFVLKWVKTNLSARITPRLAEIQWFRPWMATVCSMLLGMAAGAAFATGWGFLAGITAAVSQVLDGVDGQLARLTNRQSPAGAFLDSVLDRYTDGFLVLGMIAYNMRLETPEWLLWTAGALAITGSGLISYSSARAEGLGFLLGRPTLASKGTRTTAAAVAGLLSPVFPVLPLAALCYLAVHTNIVVLCRIQRVFSSNPTK